MAAFPLVCCAGTPLASPVFVKHAGGEWGTVSQLGIPETVIAVTLSRTAIKADRRCLLCHHRVRRACRKITSFLNGWRRLISDGYTGEKISQLSH